MSTMSDTLTLDHTINKAAFWSAIGVIVTGIVSIFLPLDAPEGPFAERMVWFSSHLGAFTMGWVVQMIAMLTLSGLFAATAWQVRRSNPLSAFFAGVAVLIATIAFIIVKFIAIWSMPQMVVASTTVTTNAAVAEQLLQQLNPSLPYSLFQSLDYLGFWMYAVFGLLVAKPLFRLSLSAKIAGVALGVFGILFHILLVTLLTGNLVTTDIGVYFGMAFVLLVIPVISLAVYFRQAIKIRNKTGDV